MCREYRKIFDQGFMAIDVPIETFSKVKKLFNAHFCGGSS